MKPLARIALLVVATAVALAAGVAPAFADVGRGPVPSGATVGGVALFGLSEADARAAIIANTPPIAFAPLDVACAGTTRTVDPGAAVAVDAGAMLDEAYASSSATPFALAPRYSVDPATVAGWVSQFSGLLNRSAVSSRYVVSGRSLVVSPSAQGRRVDAAAGVIDLTAAVRAAIAADGAVQPTVELQAAGVAPSVSEATIGESHPRRSRAVQGVLLQRRPYREDVPVRHRDAPLSDADRHLPHHREEEDAFVDEPGQRLGEAHASSHQARPEQPARHPRPLSQLGRDPHPRDLAVPFDRACR